MNLCTLIAKELTILPGADMVEGNPVLEERVVHFTKKQECNYKEQALCCQNDVQSEDVAIRGKTDSGLPRCYPLLSIVTHTIIDLK